MVLADRIIHIIYKKKLQIFDIFLFRQFICENVCIAKSGPRLKSGQVFIVQADSIVIRSAKP
ncbi:hypothetical protein V6Z11_A07G155100 [Gossypium hirsutum]